MRNVTSRLLVLGIIVLAAYSLELKLDLFPAIAESDEPIVAVDKEKVKVKKLEGSAGEAETGPYNELELQLAAGFQSRSERFTVSYTGNRKQLSDNMTDIIRSALRHDDYSAYILESYLYTIRSWGNKSTIAVEARFRETEDQTAAVDRKVDETLAEILTPGMNDHEKIKVIHDWIVTHVEYDQSLSYYTAYDAITLGKTVCQGYSLLGYKMLEKAGLEVLIAEGSVNTGEHAWNMVKLAGSWYHLDMTWDDPVGASSDSRIRYSYYLKTDEELRRDHQWTRTYPAAGTSYADTLRELELGGTGQQARLAAKLKLALGLHWLEEENTVRDKAALKKTVAAAVRSGANSLQFRYVEADGFPEALKEAFGDVGVAVGYRASYEPYAGEGSLIVSIQLEYP
ncbi:transglutaminase domain-containing protein [Paenibacillus sp. LHD-117]|uniref:transglutaminase domain-containing protein n=1 Tax=Paenibacillus sp. LHD-117 TaxID=3071412 RepID=UPI0027DFB180|nr:transglutaminase domain-containing protein [Paenibacillus sp. LHD-117]MDQ6421177.1 transglutaminase domain-containing protein [Paenibacillus sp. LHD-117]